MDLKVIWVKGYDEFVDWIVNNGMPDGVAFDHDLADFKDGDERTGLTCVKWLCNYCLDNKVKFPLYSFQSANPTGRENMESYIKSYKKNCE